MRHNSQLRILSLILSVLIFIFSAHVHASGANRPDLGAEAAVTDTPSLTEAGDGSSVATENASAYSHIDPENLVPKAMLNKALTYFDKNKNIIKNQEYIVVIDYKQHNSKERFFLIDVQSGQVEKYLVAHGKGSDLVGLVTLQSFLMSTCP